MLPINCVIENISLPLSKELSDFDIPWPFLSLLNHAKSKADFQNYKLKLENGLMGSPDEWMKAEERWTTKGITMDDILYMTNEHFPYDNKIAEIGFPLVNVGPYYRFGFGEGFRNLFNEFDKLINDPQYSFIHSILMETNRTLVQLVCIYSLSDKFPNIDELQKFAKYEFKKGLDFGVVIRYAELFKRK